MTRINKFFTEHGICSRRQADAHIEAGNVSINGLPAKLGDQVGDGDTVTLNGERVVTEKQPPLLIAYNKPVGVECTMDERDPQSIPHFLKLDTYIFTIGRLDQMSEGLLLMTNQGDWVNRVLRTKFGHEKEYEILLDRNLHPRDLSIWRKGVDIGDEDRGLTLPCRVDVLDHQWIRVVLKEGRNRQIRRCAEALGYRVKRLKRVRVANIQLGNCESNAYRVVEGEELALFVRNLGLGDGATGHI